MQKDINEIEKKLWEMADNLRANSKLNANEYFMPILGILFLKFFTEKFKIITNKLENDDDSYKGLNLHEERIEYQKTYVQAHKSLYLPPEASFDYIKSLPANNNIKIGEAINNAMKLIEENNIKDNEKYLLNVLPKNYEILEDKLLIEMFRIFDGDEINKIKGDKFGLIYEYFLNEFAKTSAQEGGEFFTPVALVKLIVEIIKPERGIILDPACGSAGMFVQSGHFIEKLGYDPSETLTIYGQEKTTINTKIAKMNLAIHSLNGDIKEANTYSEDAHKLVEQCDFVMANPPFNVNKVDLSDEILNKENRLIVVDKKKKLPKNDNANYLWIQYFYKYLNENGRAGFVMASSASDAGYSEKDIIKLLVETGAVEVMISIRSNFFYTVSLPCMLWFFNRKNEREDYFKEHTLMIDAREIYRVVTRKINDFSDEQIINLSTIVELFRKNEFALINTVSNYFDRLKELFNQVEETYNFYKENYEEYKNKIFNYAIIHPAYKNKLITFEKDESKNYLDSFLTEFIKIASYKITSNVDLDNANKLQKGKYKNYLTVYNECEKLKKAVEKEFKYIFELIDEIIKNNTKIKDKKLVPADWKVKTVREKRAILGNSKTDFIELIELLKYLLNQIEWLQEKFPDAVYKDVPGLCKIVTRKEIEENDFSLTPGRYVGLTPKKEDDFDFAERLKEIHLELEILNNEAAELAKTISANFLDLGL